MKNLLALNWKMNKPPSEARVWAQELGEKLEAGQADIQPGRIRLQRAAPNEDRLVAAALQMGVGAGFVAMLPAVANAAEVTESEVQITTPDGVCDAYFVHPSKGTCGSIAVSRMPPRDMQAVSQNAALKPTATISMPPTAVPAQLLHGVVVQHRAVALGDGELAQHGVVEPELVLVATGQQAERGRRSDVAQLRGPLGAERRAGPAVIARLGVGEQAQHVLAQALVDGHAGARHGPEGRRAADVHGLAEVELQRQGVGGELGPERAAGPGHGRRKAPRTCGAWSGTP